MRRRIVDYSSHDSLYKLDVKSMEWEKLVEKQREEYYLDVEDTLRSLCKNIKSWKVDNNRLIEA